MEFSYLSQCLICNSKEVKNLFSFKAKDEIEYEIYKCKRCGLHFGNPIPILTDDAVHEIYSSEYFKNYYSKNVEIEDVDQSARLYKTYEKQYSIFEKSIIRKSGLSVLDVGCGDGKFLEIFKKHGWKCYGIEPASYARELLKKKKLECLDVKFLDIHDKNESFDLILMDNVIEHVDFPGPYIKKAYELLNKEGLLIIKTPNSGSIKDNIETIILRILSRRQSNNIMAWIKKRYGMGTGRVHRYGNLHPPIHNCIFNKKSISWILNTVGFNKEDIDVYNASIYNSVWMSKGKNPTTFFARLLQVVDIIGDKLSKGDQLISIAQKK